MIDLYGMKHYQKYRFNIRQNLRDWTSLPSAKETIPSDDMYNKFIYMVKLMKQYNYDQQKMYEGFPFRRKRFVLAVFFT